MSYIKAADLARRCNVSRAAVSKAIRDGRIGADHIRRQGSTVLIELRTGLQVLGHHAPASPPPPVNPQMASLFAWAAPAPAAAAEPAQQEIQAPPEIGAVLARELDWITQYAAFREWITDGITLELLRNLPDPAPVGEVMVLCRQLLLGRLQQLDAVERHSRFSAEQMQQRR